MGRDIRQHERDHRQKIEIYLQKMHRSSEQLRTYRILQGGISGSATYRLQLAGEDFILKVTSITSERGMRERAQRELSFYQTFASRLPLHTPQLIAHVYDAEVIALLLKAYKPSAPPIQWRLGQYLEVAEKLGQMHATFWQNTEYLSQFSWLRSHQWTFSRRHVQHAVQQWQRLSNDPRFQPSISASRHQKLIGLLLSLEGIESLLASFPLTVCHGDCHADNLLRDEQGQLVWADWQEVGVGLGPVDLTFFAQRAFKAGGTVPFEAMIITYHRRLEAETGKQIPLALLRQTLAALELRSWLCAWPAYLMDASPQWLSLLFERIDLLASQLYPVVQRDNS